MTSDNTDLQKLATRPKNYSRLHSTVKRKRENAENIWKKLKNEKY